MSNKGWIGVDLDGTLAEYDSWRGADHIGKPIPLMLDRVKGWVAANQEVRIFTARVGGAFEEAEAARPVIEAWILKHVGHPLRVTCVKDYGMIELWDDRCIQVIPNTGRTIADELAAERNARAGKP